MKAAMVMTGTGPLVVLTDRPSFEDPVFCERLHEKGVDKFIAYELPLEAARERYGAHFATVVGDLRQNDELRILDEDGQRAFHLFRLAELGLPVMHEQGA